MDSEAGKVRRLDCLNVFESTSLKRKRNFQPIPQINIYLQVIFTYHCSDVYTLYKHLHTHTQILKKLNGSILEFPSHAPNISYHTHPVAHTHTHHFGGPAI